MFINLLRLRQHQAKSLARMKHISGQRLLLSTILLTAWSVGQITALWMNCVEIREAFDHDGFWSRLASTICRSKIFSMDVDNKLGSAYSNFQWVHTEKPWCHRKMMETLLKAIVLSSSYKSFGILDFVLAIFVMHEEMDSVKQLLRAVTSA